MKCTTLLLGLFVIAPIVVSGVVVTGPAAAQAPAKMRVGQHVEAYTYTRDGSGKDAWRKGVVTEVFPWGAHVRMDDDGEIVTVGNWNLRGSGEVAAKQPVVATPRNNVNDSASASSVEAYRRAVELHPTAAGYERLAAMYKRAGMAALEAAAYEKEAALLETQTPPAAQVGAAAAAAARAAPQPAAPARAGGSVTLGEYNCVSATRGIAIGGQSRLRIQSGGVYVDHLGTRGSYTYDAAQQLIRFRGGEKDGVSATYEAGAPRPVIHILSPSGRHAFDCEHP